MGIIRPRSISIPRGQTAVSLAREIEPRARELPEKEGNHGAALDCAEPSLPLLFEPVGFALDVNSKAMAQETVQDGGGDKWVAEDVSPHCRVSIKAEAINGFDDGGLVEVWFCEMLALFSLGHVAFGWKMDFLRLS